MSEPSYNDVLNYWFGAQLDGIPVEDKSALWFQGEATVDQYNRAQFGVLVEQARHHELDDWQQTPKSLLALILLLDQFPRSIYRKSPAAFSGDTYARDLSHRMIDLAWDKQLTLSERLFAYLPLMHAENLEDQELCLQMLQTLNHEAPAHLRGQFEQALAYSHDHRDIIARFDRFPHRNATLGRESTPSEQAFLDQGADHYGQ